ncbi:type II toxin-antitoxin system RelE/ParE family toxin [Aurantimonas sp. VKM B-3413]|uniref:type II toxin-antitoxin system RelE/ParE family toxin n=1 Tax=Aurantimonas sp. VKM B-3413 TaxID=2779401 RepID=UPI001E5683E5|nr:type II toxin-antitoxin system RelE/ParE family toxin [Aurantimonas sp. VKM B-3413]
MALDSPRAAERLAKSVVGRTAILADNPMLGRRGRAFGTRDLVITGTPYIVVYRANAVVEILAVIHGARRWPEES